MPSHICAGENTHTHREKERQTERKASWGGNIWGNRSEMTKYHINETGASSLCSSFSICICLPSFMLFMASLSVPPPRHHLVAMHVACTPAPSMLPLSLLRSHSLTHLDSLVIFHSSVSQGPPALPSTPSSTPSHHLSTSCKTFCAVGQLIIFRQTCYFLSGKCWFQMWSAGQCLLEMIPPPPSNPFLAFSCKNSTNLYQQVWNFLSKKMYNVYSILGDFFCLLNDKMHGIVMECYFTCNPWFSSEPQSTNALVARSITRLLCCPPSLCWWRLYSSFQMQKCSCFSLLAAVRVEEKAHGRVPVSTAM